MAVNFGGDTDFGRLAAYADSHKGRSLPPEGERSELSLVQRLQLVYAERGESEATIDDIPVRYESAVLRLNALRETHKGAIVSFMRRVREKFSDSRDPLRTVYYMDTVLVVTFMALMAGCRTCEDIAQYWYENNVELQVLVPGMPGPEYMISPDTVKAVLCLIDGETAAAFFREYFTQALDLMNSQTSCDPNMANILDFSDCKRVLSADGQEMRGTSRKGNYNRRCKGGHVTTLFDNDSQTALDYVVVNKKNNEDKALLKMLTNVSVEGCLISADALSSRDYLAKAIVKAGAGYLLNVKSNNNDTEELRQAVKEAFDLAHMGKARPGQSYIAPYRYVHKDPDDQWRHGRREHLTIEQIPASAVDPEVLKNTSFPDIKSVVRYTKVVVTKYTPSKSKKKKTKIKKNRNERHRIAGNYVITMSTRYYISTEEFSVAGFKNVVKCILEYWGIEAMHNSLDTALDQDKLIMREPKHIESRAALNKMLWHVLKWVRDHNPSPTRHKFAIKRVQQRLGDVFVNFRNFTEYWLDMAANGDNAPPEEEPKRVPNFLLEKLVD